MPDRIKDELAIWKYDLVQTGVDLQRHPQAVRFPDLVESVGTDGRYEGSIRPFPGFAGSEDHGLGYDDLTGVQFAKYASVRKGLTNYTLRGIVYLCDSEAYPGYKRLVFSYVDTEDGSSNTALLEEFHGWATTTVGAEPTCEWYEPLTFTDFDISSTDKYIYFTAVATFPGSGHPDGRDDPYPFNRAYYFDFKINSWDVYIDTETFGVFGQRPMGRFHGGTIPDIDNELRDAVTDSGNLPAQMSAASEGCLSNGTYSTGVMLVSRKHHLRSHLIPFYGTVVSGSGTPPNKSIEWYIRRNQHFVNTQLFSDSTYYWGLQDFDGAIVYRSPAQTGTPTATEYEILGRLYKEIPYADFRSQADAGAGAGSNFESETSVTGWNYNLGIDPELTASETVQKTATPDNALVSTERYDPFLDEFGEMPRTKRILCMDQTTAIVASPFERADPEGLLLADTLLAEDIRWSSLTTNEVENFPTGNSYRPQSGGEQFYGLYAAGDYGAAVSNSAVYRLQRIGGRFTVERVLSGIGGVSRWGATGWGNNLFVLTATGLKVVDLANKTHETLRVLNRKLLDNREWAQTLANVHLAYDSVAGCLILMNTSLEECILFWEATGQVTTLDQTPFDFVTVGEDTQTTGNLRAFFVKENGQVYTIDALRTGTKRTMFGNPTGYSNVVNGTATGGSTTQLVDSTLGATDLPPKTTLQGFYLHMLSGANEGLSRPIANSGSSTQINVSSAFPSAIASGDRYSVGPIHLYVQLPQLVAPNGVDPFVRKIVSTTSVAVSDLAGETSSNDVNNKITVGYLRRDVEAVAVEVDLNEVPDRMNARTNCHGTQIFPFLENRTSNADFELNSVLIRGTISGSEAESRQG